MTRIALREWEEITVSLPRPVVTHLADQHRNHLALTPTGDPDVWQLKSAQYVGTIRSHDHSLLITPKVPLPNLLALMSVEVPSEIWHSETVDLATDPDLLAVMARLFCVACESTTRRGLRSDYVHRQEMLISPRGRIDIRAIINRPGLKVPVPCRYDEHSPDIELNRLLRAALRTATRTGELSPHWRYRLRLQLAEFEGVTDTPNDPSWVESWTPQPMERHYESSVRLASLILAGTSISSRFGEQPAHSFLLDMNTLFERYVTRRLQEAAPNLTVEEQPKSKLDENGRVDINPDIVFRRDGWPIAVADTKYKLLNAGKGDPSDYYQALAYATAYGLNEAWLIYARTPGEEPAGTIRVRNSPVTIRTVGLDLNVPIAQLDQQITSIAELISDKPEPTEAPTGQLVGAES